MYRPGRLGLSSDGTFLIFLSSFSPWVLPVTSTPLMAQKFNTCVYILGLTCISFKTEYHNLQLPASACESPSPAGVALVLARPPPTHTVCFADISQSATVPVPQQQRRHRQGHCTKRYMGATGAIVSG